MSYILVKYLYKLVYFRLNPMEYNGILNSWMIRDTNKWINYYKIKKRIKNSILQYSYVRVDSIFYIKKSHYLRAWEACIFLFHSVMEKSTLENNCLQKVGSPKVKYMKRLAECMHVLANLWNKWWKKRSFSDLTTKPK